MKILHLFSDWKWTGPAEPVLSLCEALGSEGVDVTLAYRKTPLEFHERTVEKEVKKRSIKYYEGLRLNRYFSAKDWCYDIRSLNPYCEKEGFDIVHTNLSHDHYTAIVGLSFLKKRPFIVRTDHKRDGMPPGSIMSWALSRTDGIVTYSRKIKELDRDHFHYPEDRMCVIPPGIHIYEGPVRNIRHEFGLRMNERVIGVIGRLKPNRGFDVILKAFKILRGRVDNVKLLIMGRSSQIEESVIKPLHELHLENDVILAGYRIDDYFAVISLFDIFVMMRAGSDGSARALREVMGMGKPAIVSDAGMLCELVEEGKTGYVVKWDAQELAARMEALLADDGKRRQFGEAARQTAADKWDYRNQAKIMKNFYEELIRKGKI